MTITYDDDPEIALGGQGGGDDDDDGAPSAPTAMAIAMPISATESAAAASVQQPSQATVPLSTGDGTIEYATNTSDGSLAVKSVTTTQPNGYRNIETEYFHIPNHMANTVLMSLGAGNKPSSLYRTNMQQQILPPTPPPSSAQGTNSTPATAIAIPPSGTQGHVSSQPNNTIPISNNNDQPNASTLTGNAGGGMEYRVFGFFFIVIAIIVMISVGAANQDKSPSYNSSPSYPSWTPAPFPTPAPYPYPSYPSPSPHSYPSTPSYPSSPHWMCSDPLYAPIYNCKTTSTSPTITPNPTKSPTPTYSPVIYAPHPPFDHIWPPFLPSTRHDPSHPNYTDTIHKKKEPDTTLAGVK